MSWWRRKQAAMDPEAVLAALPQVAHSLIVHLGPDDATKPYYWQLRRQDQVRDLALMAKALPARDQSMPLTAAAVADFIQHAAGLAPMYLLGVDKAAIDASVFAQLAHGIKTGGQRAYLIVPAAVMYDFLASGRSVVRVGEFLDGWPMRQAATLSAYVLDQGVASCLMPAPLPAESSVAYAGWHAADPAVMALFDAPLRRVTDRSDTGTFVFTDLQ